MANGKPTAKGRPRTAASRNGHSPEPDVDPRAKLAAAVAEPEDVEAEEPTEPKHVQWRDMDLELPATLPWVVTMDLVELERGEDPLSVMRTLRELLGPEQFRRVRSVFDRDTPLEEMSSVVRLVFSQYGVSLGESDASRDS